MANYHAATDSALVDVGIEPTDKLFHGASTGLLGDAAAKKLVGPDKLARLTRENVLTVNPSTRLVTFNSRYIQTFFTETGVLWPIVCCRSLLAHGMFMLVWAPFAHCNLRQRSTEFSIGTLIRCCVS